MTLQKILTFAHDLLAKALKNGGFAVDATMGNGNDTLRLANLVGSKGHVYAFDIQAQALENTQQRLQAANLEARVSLYLQGHEHVAHVIPKTLHGKIKAAIFNLGYLPGSDKTVVTTPQTTLTAIEQLLAMLAPTGIVIIVVYHGHEGGKVERDALMPFVTQLSQQEFHVLQYQFLNQQNNAPFIIAIERK